MKEEPVMNKLNVQELLLEMENSSKASLVKLGQTVLAEGASTTRNEIVEGTLPEEKAAKLRHSIEELINLAKKLKGQKFNIKLHIIEPLSIVTSLLSTFEFDKTPENRQAMEKVLTITLNSYVQELNPKIKWIGWIPGVNSWIRSFVINKVTPAVSDFICDHIIMKDND